MRVKSWRHSESVSTRLATVGGTLVSPHPARLPEIGAIGRNCCNRRCGESDPLQALPDSRTHADRPVESANELTLRVEPASKPDRCQLQVAAPQQMLGTLDARAELVLMRRNSRAAAKGTREVGFREVDRPGELRERDVVSKFVINHRLDPPKLPGRESAFDRRNTPWRTGVTNEVDQSRKHQGLGVKPAVDARHCNLFGQSL